MRVAIVLKTFPPDVIGGMETQTKQMGTELQKTGHNITVFTKKFGNHDDSDVPYEVKRVWNWKLTPFVSDFTFLIVALFSIIRRRAEFDIVQCMMIYPVGFLGYIVNKLIGMPYFAWIRGGDYYLMNEIWWKRWMMRCVLTDTLVLVQSEEIKSDVIADFDQVDCRIDVLGNAVTVPEDTASGEGVLYVGRLAPKKGLKYLIEAVAELDTHLTVVGDGQEREQIKRLATERGANVTFEGEVQPDHVDKYYKSAAVFVLPSVEGEGMPNVILEAMSWGLPVVATKSGGVPSVVIDDQNGYLVPMRDPKALATKIEKLLDDPERSQQLGSNAREFVVENHSWEALCEELESYYHIISSRC